MLRDPGLKTAEASYDDRKYEQNVAIVESFPAESNGKTEMLANIRSLPIKEEENEEGLMPD